MQQLLVTNIFAFISKMQYLINKKLIKSLLDWPKKFSHMITLPDFKAVQSFVNCDKVKGIHITEDLLRKNF